MSVTTNFGANPCFLRSLRINRNAARLSRRLWTSMSLGAEVRTGDRTAVTSAPSPPERSMAPSLDEMVVRIAGKRMYLWRAVDHEGEVLDMLVQSRRDSRAALRLMRKLLRKQGFVPKLLVTDKLRSYGSAFRQSSIPCPAPGDQSSEADCRDLSPESVSVVLSMAAGAKARRSPV